MLLQHAATLVHQGVPEPQVRRLQRRLSGEMYWTVQQTITALLRARPQGRAAVEHVLQMALHRLAIPKEDADD